jgi:hypothetical protein
MDATAGTQEVEGGGASGLKGINWKLNWRKSTRQKNCTSNREAVRNGCFKVMLTPSSFMLVLRGGATCWVPDAQTPGQNTGFSK